MGETKGRLKDVANGHIAVDKPTNISKPTKICQHILTTHYTANGNSLILYYNQ